jgi:hypothetical protein
MEPDENDRTGLNISSSEALSVLKIWTEGRLDGQKSVEMFANSAQVEP